MPRHSTIRRLAAASAISAACAVALAAPASAAPGAALQSEGYVVTAQFTEIAVGNNCELAAFDGRTYNADQLDSIAEFQEASSSILSDPAKANLTATESEFELSLDFSNSGPGTYVVVASCHDPAEASVSTTHTAQEFLLLFPAGPALPGDLFGSLSN
jgi:hypothetical protein